MQFDELRKTLYETFVRGGVEQEGFTALVSHKREKNSGLVEKSLFTIFQLWRVAAVDRRTLR